MDGFDNIVSVKWLKDHLNHQNVVVLNGTIQKVSSNFKSEEQQIENARFFDIKNAFSDASAEFPNTIPSEIQFQTEAQKLGINKEDFIVVYDEFGIYSSPRVWWLFKTFGHNNVAVLDGGFPEWKAQKFPTEVKTEKQYNSGNFIAKYKPNNIVYFESLVDNSFYDKSATFLFKGRYLQIEPVVKNASLKKSLEEKHQRRKKLRRRGPN